MADNTLDNLVDSRIIMGADADPDLLASPANISKCVAKRKLGGKDYLDNSRRRRLSINEMCVSPNLRARDSSTERSRANTWTGSATKQRVKKTPKYRVSKKAGKVDPNQPLISDSFTPTSKVTRDPRV